MRQTVGHRCQVPLLLYDLYATDLATITRGAAGLPASVCKINRLDTNSNKHCTNVNGANVTLGHAKFLGALGPTTVAHVSATYFAFSINMSTSCTHCSFLDRRDSGFANGPGHVDVNFHILPH